jgi:hypothetical protein
MFKVNINPFTSKSLHVFFDGSEFIMTSLIRIIVYSVSQPKFHTLTLLSA